MPHHGSSRIPALRRPSLGAAPSWLSRPWDPCGGGLCLGLFSASMNESERVFRLCGDGESFRSRLCLSVAIISVLRKQGLQPQPGDFAMRAVSLETSFSCQSWASDNACNLKDSKDIITARWIEHAWPRPRPKRSEVSTETPRVPPLRPSPVSLFRAPIARCTDPG